VSQAAAAARTMLLPSAGQASRHLLAMNNWNGKQCVLQPTWIAAGTTPGRAHNSPRHGCRCQPAAQRWLTAPHVRTCGAALQLRLRSTCSYRASPAAAAVLQPWV
jgi:hypothetical protein